MATFHNAILLSSAPVAIMSSDGENRQVRMELPLGWLRDANGWPLLASHRMHLPSVEHDARIAVNGIYTFTSTAKNTYNGLHNRFTGGYGLVSNYI